MSNFERSDGCEASFRSLKYPEIPVEFTVKNIFDAPEIDRCPRCGAIGKDVKINPPPLVILDCKLDFPKYTCIKCGYNWGSLL